MSDNETAQDILDRAKVSEPKAFRHGYYIASQNLMAGNLRIAIYAKIIFENFGLTPDKQGNYQGGKYDGVSIYEDASGKATYRIVMQNFFSQDNKIMVHDIERSIFEYLVGENYAS